MKLEAEQVRLLSMPFTHINLCDRLWNGSDTPTLLQLRTLGK